MNYIVIFLPSLFLILAQLKKIRTQNYFYPNKASRYYLIADNKIRAVFGYGKHGKLGLVHLQLDELWANVKQTGQDVWVWTVCDARTKLIPIVQIGPRTQEMAYAMAHGLKPRLKAGCVPVFSSDGLKYYFLRIYNTFGCSNKKADVANVRFFVALAVVYGRHEKELACSLGVRSLISKGVA